MAPVEPTDLKMGGVTPHSNAQRHPNAPRQKMQLPMQIIPFDLLCQIRDSLPPVEEVDPGGAPLGEGIVVAGVKIMKMCLTEKLEDGTEKLRWTWGFPGIVTFTNLSETETAKL